jgi:DNA-binding winged helix-turn-helix (wHTH) protein
MLYGFGPFEVDGDRFELRRAGEKVALERKAFDLLSFLIERRAIVCKENEIAAAVWPTLDVSPAVLEQAVNMLRRALGDEAEPPQWILRAPGRGYRFIGKLSLRTPPPRSSRPAPASERARFVGRAEALALIADACAYPPAVVLVEGDAGIGKSRLLAEVRARVPARDHVIIVEDVDRADPATLEALRAHVADVSERGLALLVTSRPSQDEAVVEILDALRGHPSAKIVALAPFSLEETSDYATALAGRPLSLGIVEQLYQKTSGHPLSLAQLSHVFQPYSPWSEGGGDDERQRLQAMMSEHSERAADVDGSS